MTILTKVQIDGIAALAGKAVWPDWAPVSDLRAKDYDEAILTFSAHSRPDVLALCATVRELREALANIGNDIEANRRHRHEAECQCWACITVRRIEEMLK